MKKIFILFLLSSVLIACKHNEDTPEETLESMMDLDLSYVNSIIGKWSVYYLLYGDIISQTPEEVWEINSDGTMVREVSVYTYNATYTYDNGVLNYSADSYNTPDLRTYIFRHHDDEYLKVEYYWHENQTSPIVYMIK